MSVKLNYSFGQNSQLGKKKEYNTDAILEFPIPDGHVFLVCDGHDGDEGHGALAAKLTAESIKKYFFNRTYKDALSALTNAVTYANFAVHEQATKDPKYSNIGSTLAIVIYKSNKAYYAYAGDSRIYIHKDDKLKALTLDHVEDRYNPSGSEVNVLLGRNKDIKFGVCKNPIELAVNDKILLCTDGLTDVVSNEKINEVISDPNTSPDHKVLLLMQEVDENNGEDNSTVHVIEFDNKHPLPNRKTQFGLMLKALLGIIFIVALGYGGYVAYEYLSNKKTLVEVEAPDQANYNDTNEPVLADKEVEAVQEIDVQIAPKVVVIEDKKPIIQSNVNQQSEQYYNHKVQFGENLYRLSLRYGVTQEQLKNANGEKAIKLVAGSSLKIPVKAVHTVHKGESYSVLSDKYNTKIDIICRANNIDRNTPLSEGKIVVIPYK